MILRDLRIIAATPLKPIATTDFTNPMPTRVDLRLPDEVAEDVLRHKPRTMSLSGFCLFLIEIGVDRDAKLPAYRVGAGHIGNLTTEQVEPTPAEQVALGLQAVEFSAPEISSPSLVSVGDGVGRESEGTPRKNPNPRRDIPTGLRVYSDLIHDFWRVKGGSKGDRAWNLLIGQLLKIQKLYGNETLESQIELAVNGKWKGITVANLERFRQPDKKGPAEPARHPASRVFTAQRGFEDEAAPTANPLLEDLF